MAYNTKKPSMDEKQHLEVPKRSETTRNRKYAKFRISHMIENYFGAHLEKKIHHFEKNIF